MRWAHQPQGLTLEQCRTPFAADVVITHVKSDPGISEALCVDRPWLEPRPARPEQWIVTLEPAVPFIRVACLSAAEAEDVAERVRRYDSAYDAAYRQTVRIHPHRSPTPEVDPADFGLSSAAQDDAGDGG